MVELTDQEKYIIDESARAFWADLKVMVSGDAVLLFVDSHRHDFDYPTILRICDNPQEVKRAVEEYPGYKNRSTVSCRYMREHFEKYGDFGGTVDIDKTAEQYVNDHRHEVTV